MRRAPLTGLAVAATVFVLDQLAKLGIARLTALDELAEPHRITGFFNLRFVANHGVSLGKFQAGSDIERWALVAITGAIAAAVAFWMTREANRADQAALGLILGGALGNIVDRARLGFVIDYADLHFGEWRPFLVFNLADAAITVGVVALLVRALFVREKAHPSENSHA